MTNYPGTIIIHGTALLVITFLISYFSRIWQKRIDNKRGSAGIWEERFRKMEEIAKNLKDEAHKADTVKDDEKEDSVHETAKKQQNEYIEKLRKTQKAMVFMIEDLNEMSSLLKDSRDQLEDKVRERTDELMKINRKLQRSERLAFLGKLAGSITHELRNPLAVLKNAAYFLDIKLKEHHDEKMTKYTEIVNREVTMIDTIIEDIMSFAKTKPPEFKETDIKGFLEDMISKLNVPKMIQIKKKFTDLPPISIDSKQLAHAVVNIANNAIMAMNGNGILTFSTEKEDKYICIEIKDTGPGIPAAQKNLIFEPLYTSKSKGTGLGLPIAKMMVENQEGKIEFKSKTGKGTIFKISLPITRS